MISRDHAESLFMELANMSHYHVVAAYADSLTYTDGILHESALAHAAELIAPASGSGPEPDLRGVWIAESPGQGCPLAHGDDAAEDGEDDYLLTVLNESDPYWSAPEMSDPSETIEP